MQVEPYLSFEGRADEAIEFYKTALGAKVEMLMRFKDAPPDACPSMPEGEDKVMHASLMIGNSRVMVSDGRMGGKAVFSGISLSIAVASDAEAQRVFAALGNGGQVCVPLSKTFFASSFGMVTDKFGVTWMVIAGNK
jgi:PhnB protein